MIRQSFIWVGVISLFLIQTTPKKSILFLIAPKDFRDEEFKIPFDHLKKLGYELTVASYDTTLVTGMLGMKVKPTKRLVEIDTSKFHCLILIGGSGAKVFFDDTTVHRLVRHFARKKLVAAICISPITLARAGVLSGKKATVWKDPSLINELKKLRVKYLAKDVVRDQNILTASGPKATKKFSEELEKALRE